MPTSFSAPPWLARSLWALMATLGLLLAGGCAQLPTQVDRPVSHALASPAGTPLAALVQQRHDDAGARFDSGFLLLDGPQAAYGSRLALIEGAQKTLDLQYYAIHADGSTRRLLTAVHDAAARGVRVRILIDDFHSTGRDALVLLLAFEKNIEVRLFNPLAGARGSAFNRMLNALGDVARLQQRMHNKLFLADNVLGVTGGRNLGDAYFGNGQSGNFIDLDVLSAGPIVQDLSRSFDRYWNNERAYPVQALVTREELNAIRDTVRLRTHAPPPAGRATPPAPSTSTSTPPETAPPPGATPPGRRWDERPLDLRSAAFVWAPAMMLVDRPGKIPANPREEATAPPGDLAPPSPRAGPASAAQTAAEGDTVVEGLLQLIGQARRDLLIISPYFVPGPEIHQAFADARRRGVRVRVLTNSLASNDAPIAHVGYARHRQALLRMGVELYEMRSEQAGLGSAFGASGAALTGESRAMLHAKVMVLDGRLLVVGSMNLDLRSQLQNTEIALLIHSATLSRLATGVIEKTLERGAWHVALDDIGLLWRAPQGSALQDRRTEPDASAALQLWLKLLGPLAPDRLL